MPALTETGFKRPLYEDLLNEQINRAKALFGEDINTEETSVLGKFIRMQVYDLSKAYEELEMCYYARFPNTAVGVSLDRLCVYAGITRHPPTAAVHTITITGTAGALISSGFVVGTVDGLTFTTTTNELLDENGTLTINVYCTELGTVGNVAVGEITEIINPSAKVTGITHTAIYSAAVNEETDVELRERFTQGIRGTGSGTLSSVRAAILAVDNVKDCMIIENATDETVDGRPPHSFECVVSAPITQKNAIAQTIFDKKPIGIATVGSTSDYATDNSGHWHLTYFSFVENVEITVNVKVKIGDTFATDGAEQIRTAIYNKINSLAMGDDVIYTSLYSSIFSVDGVVDVETLELSTNGSTFVTENITVAPTQIAIPKTITIEVE